VPDSFCFVGCCLNNSVVMCRLLVSYTKQQCCYAQTTCIIQNNSVVMRRLLVSYTKQLLLCADYLYHIQNNSVVIHRLLVSYTKQQCCYAQTACIIYKTTVLLCADCLYHIQNHRVICSQGRETVHSVQKRMSHGIIEGITMMC